MPLPATIPRPRPFLSAEWRYLSMINYAVNPALLASHVPAGTELDSFDGRTFISMVGFIFDRTRVLGVPVPFHRVFEEVNLRFYVRRAGPEGWRRGVVFISEIVPKPAIALVARAVYNEPYRCLPMRHSLELPAGPREAVTAEYGWKFRGQWNSLSVTGSGEPTEAGTGSEEEFITEHFWGYTGQRDGGCLEYEVEHPRWRLWRARASRLRCDTAALYGREFAGALAGKPSSAFLAEGSAVTVRRGVRLPLS